MKTEEGIVTWHCSMAGKTSAKLELKSLTHKRQEVENRNGLGLRLGIELTIP